MLTQKAVIDVLSEYFVCIEYDPTALGVPMEKYPGLWRMGVAWENNPWTRVSFGTLWIIEPEGQYMLSPLGALDEHNSVSKTRLINFDKLLRGSLDKLAQIRAHPRGSAEETEAIGTLAPDLREFWVSKADLFLDGRTKQIFEAAENQNTRYPGVFEFPDPWVRRRAIELIGRYSEVEEVDGFLPGGEWSVFGESVARCLDDEDAEVRIAAANAVFQFGGTPAPSVEGADLIAAARESWEQAEGAAAAR